MKVKMGTFQRSIFITRIVLHHLITYRSDISHSSLTKYGRRCPEEINSSVLNELVH